MRGYGSSKLRLQWPGPEGRTGNMTTSRAPRTGSLGVSWLVAASYAALAVAFSWPLGRDLTGQLPGLPNGDTGVYVWNLWVFRDALIRGEWPFATSSILALAPRVNLSLENYTVFQNILAAPLLSFVDATAAFNLIFMSMSALTAWATFQLALTLTAHRGIAWLAGVAFAWSPVLVARSTEHMSLVAAAPLPLVVLALERAIQHPTRLRWMLAGVCGAWAAYCDVYFAVFAALLGALVLASRLGDWHIAPRTLTSAGQRVQSITTALAGIAGLLCAWIIVTGGRTLVVGPVRIHVVTLFTPMLVLCIVLMLRWWLRNAVGVTPTVHWQPSVLTGVGWAVATAALTLSPWLVGVAQHVLTEGDVNPPVLWRSSPSGVDLAAFFAPNPNSALLDVARPWLTKRPGGFVENVASIPWTVLVVVALTWRWWRVDVSARRWLTRALVFGVLALGPFVHVLGFNSTAITPWTLMRYVPLVGLVRTPTRFSIVAMLAMSMLFVAALAAAHARLGRRGGRALVVACGLALLVELSPVPRPVYAAQPPALYDVIASDARDVRVMELPFGVRDGTFSMGRYSAASQYYQTHHQKRLTGGYLSRVPRSTRALYSGPFFRTVMDLSAGQSPDHAPRDVVIQRGRARMTNLNIGYVVVDTRTTPKTLVDLVGAAFDLRLETSSGPLELYTTAVGRGEVPLVASGDIGDTAGAGVRDDVRD